MSPCMQLVIIHMKDVEIPQCTKENNILDYSNIILKQKRGFVVYQILLQLRILQLPNKKNHCGKVTTKVKILEHLHS